MTADAQHLQPCYFSRSCNIKYPSEALLCLVLSKQAKRNDLSLDLLVQHTDVCALCECASENQSLTTTSRAPGVPAPRTLS
eukprot:6488187-Amphidinium_carterae.1